MNRIYATLLLALACGGQTDLNPTPSLGSETHFLTRCTSDCAGDWECLRGVCTQPCTLDTECTDLNGEATCVDDAQSNKSCQVACTQSASCQAKDSTWSCELDRCIGPVLPFSSASADSCPDAFVSGLQSPVVVYSPAEAIPDTAQVMRAVADESGLYWIDETGAVYGRPPLAPLGSTPTGPPPVTRLVVAAPTEGASVVGQMFTDATHLYWAVGGPLPANPLPGEFEPPLPGRVYSVTKMGTDPSQLEPPSILRLLAESSDTLYYLVGARDGSAYVTTGDGLYQIPDPLSIPGNPGLPPLRRLDHLVEEPDSFRSAFQMTGETLFWQPASMESNTRPVRSAGLYGGGGYPDVSIGDVSNFLVSDTHLLWAPEETLFDPLLLQQHFEMLELNTGCRQRLPDVGLSIGSQVVDKTHVYWKSFNALGSVRASSGDGESTDLDTPYPLLRVDLQTGALEQLEPLGDTGFHVSLVTDLLAQDDQALYYRVNETGALVAQRKQAVAEP